MHSNNNFNVMQELTMCKKTIDLSKVLSGNIKTFKTEREYNEEIKILKSKISEKAFELKR